MSQSKEKLTAGWFSKLDIFGIGFNFLLNGNDKYKTNTGAFFTVSYCLIVISLFFGFGVDLYQRRNPKVSFNTEVGQHIEKIMSNEEFTYAYRVEDENGNIYLDKSVVYPTIYYGSYSMVNGAWALNELTTLPIVRCHNLTNYSAKEAYFNISLASWHCVDFDKVKWGGNWDGNFVNFIQININQCSNTTNDSSCSSNDLIENSFRHSRSSGNLFYSDLSVYAQPSMTDYHNPLGTYLVNSYEVLNLLLSKRKILTFKNTTINNDVGWFFEDLKVESILSIDSVFPDLVLKDEWSQTLVYSSYLYLGKKFDTYNRSYTKIQEVIASVGGFAKFFYTGFFIFYYFLSSFYRNMLLINVISFNEDNYERSNNQVKTIVNLSNIQLNNIHPRRNNFEEKETQKKNISYCNYIYFTYCASKKFKANNQQAFMNKYQHYKKYLTETMEITSYYKLRNQFHYLKKIVLNKLKRNVLKVVKPKLKKDSDYNNEEKVLRIINNYYNNNFNTSFDEFKDLLDIGTIQLIESQNK